MLGAPNKRTDVIFFSCQLAVGPSKRIFSQAIDWYKSSPTVAPTLTFKFTHQWGWASYSESPWPAWLAHRVPCHIPQTDLSAATSTSSCALTFSSQDRSQVYGCPDGCTLFSCGYENTHRNMQSISPIIPKTHTVKCHTDHSYKPLLQSLAWNKSSNRSVPKVHSLKENKKGKKQEIATNELVWQLYLGRTSLLPNW